VINRTEPVPEPQGEPIIGLREPGRSKQASGARRGVGGAVAIKFPCMAKRSFSPLLPSSLSLSLSLSLVEAAWEGKISAPSSTTLSPCSARLLPPSKPLPVNVRWIPSPAALALCDLVLLLVHRSTP
jgi:hypothetical protein